MAKTLRLAIIATLVGATPAVARAQQPAPTGEPTPAPAGTALPSASPVPSPAEAVPSPAPPAPVITPKSTGVEFSSLRLLYAKGVITKAEYDRALADLGESMGSRAGDSSSLVLSKWAATLYGFAEANVMYHSTQSFPDFGSNFQVKRPGTYAGEHGRTQFTVRDTRFGVRLAPPGTDTIKTTGLIEMDFFGNAGAIPTTTSETSFYVNPNLRLRHAYMRLETPVVDVVLGQTWHLFGWQPNYVPASIEFSGNTAALFGRTPQLRISKTLKTADVNLDIAVAALRPPQRDGVMPEIQTGLRLSFNKWTSVHTIYVTSTSVVPASIGVSGDFRRFGVTELSATPKAEKVRYTGGIAANVYLPIIPATKENKDNSLSVLGEIVHGGAITDMYTAFQGSGAGNPALPAPAAGGVAPTFVPNVDPGLVAFSPDGSLHAIVWTTYLVSVEYYPPGVDGRIGLFGNYSHSQSPNAKDFAYAAAGVDARSLVRDSEDFFNAGFFFDPTKATRFGADYALYDDIYADGVHARNHAVQATGFLFF